MQDPTDKEGKELWSVHLKGLAFMGGGQVCHKQAWYDQYLKIKGVPYDGSVKYETSLSSDR